MSLLKKKQPEKKNEPVDEPIKESPTNLLNERVLGLREELVDFKNTTIKKITKIKFVWFGALFYRFVRLRSQV